MAYSEAHELPQSLFLRSSKIQVGISFPGFLHSKGSNGLIFILPSGLKACCLWEVGAICSMGENLCYLHTFDVRKMFCTLIER